MKNLIKAKQTRHLKRRIKLIGALVLVVILLILLGVATVKINDFFNSNYLQFNQVIAVKLQTPVEIKPRQVKSAEVEKTLNELIASIPMPSDLKTDEEKHIYKLWGIESYRMAIAVATAESHMNCNALGFNENKSVDFSLFQVNSIWLKKYSLQELTDCSLNIETAYKIWDSQDNIMGNNKGSFNPWVTAKNGSYLDYLK